MSIFSFTKVTTSENFSLIIQTQLIPFVKQMELTKGNEAQNGNKKIKIICIYYNQAYPQMSTIPFTHTFFCEKYQSNRLVECFINSRYKGVPPRFASPPKLFKKSFIKNFYRLALAKKSNPPGSTSLQERIAIHSIKVVLKIFLMSAEDPLRDFSSQRKIFNLHLDFTTG